MDKEGILGCIFKAIQTNGYNEHPFSYKKGKMFLTEIEKECTITTITFLILLV